MYNVDNVTSVNPFASAISLAEVPFLSSNVISALCSKRIFTVSGLLAAAA